MQKFCAKTKNPLNAIKQNLIAQIVERLKKRYNPEKVILFGSYAKGLNDENSDMDFFIVKNTKKNMIERLREVSALFLDRRIGMDFVIYTPEELRQRIQMNDVFVQDILKEGKILL
ncbi:MAG: nucleotidyltransferase domain-containing protein [Patescibacteria group bacterium]